MQVMYLNIKAVMISDDTCTLHNNISLNHNFDQTESDISNKYVVKGYHRFETTVVIIVLIIHPSQELDIIYN